MVAGSRLIVTASGFRSAFAAMMAPRKLQSFGAIVHAEALAVSSVRSTSNVVTNGVREELDDALRVYFRNALTSTANNKRDRASFLFMGTLQLIDLGEFFWAILLENGLTLLATVQLANGDPGERRRSWFLC